MNYDIIKFLNLEDFAYLIESIESSKVYNSIFTYVTLKKQEESCPLCGSKDYTVHNYYTKKITHSVSTGSPCFLMYKARRYKCKICNKVFYESNPFAGRRQSSTYTITSVLEALRSHTSTFTSVASLFNLTKQTVMKIFDSYVSCERKTLPSIICIDEFYTSRFSSHKYACVLVNFLTKQIIEVYSSRHMNFLASRFTIIPDRERENVKIVVIDMWDTYKDLTKRYFKKAIVAVDSFHVIKQLNEKLIKIRLRIMQKYNKKTNRLIENDMYYYMLKKFHYFFVKNFEDIYSGDIRVNKIHAKWRKDEILKYLLSIDDDLRYAYLLKEKYREFNLTADYEKCDEEFINIMNEFLNSYLPEYREFGQLLRKWKEEIINSFIRIEGRRLSNGTIEGVNSRIKTIIKNANGFCNFGRLRNKIMFSINKNEPIRNSPN